MDSTSPPFPPPEDAFQAPAEGLLRPASAANIESLFNGAPDYLWVLDYDGRILHYNRAVADGLGYGGSLLGRSVLDAHAPEQRAAAAAVFSEILAHQRQTCPFPLVRADGSLAMVETRIVEVEWDGKPVLFGVSRDVGTEMRLRSALDQIADAVLTGDLRGRLTWANPAACRLSGYAYDELLFLPLTNLLPDLPTVPVPGERESALLCRDGTRLPAEVSLSLLADGGVCVVVRDLRARKQYEAALRQSEERYRAVVETQTEVICRFLVDGTIMFVNEGYCRLFGKTAEQLIGSDWQPLVHPDDVAHVEAELAKLSPERPVVVVENQVYSGTGTLHWMEFVNRACFGVDGQITEILSVGRDISKRKQLENELTASRQQMHQLLEWHIASQTVAALAHELNQPLTSIAAYSALIRRNQEKEPAASELCVRAVAGLATEVERAGRVLRDLLASTHKPEVVMEPLDLATLLRDAIVLVQASGYDDCRVRTDFAPDLPVVRVCRPHIEKVVWILLSNGIEAMREAGRSKPVMRVAAARDGDAVRVSVSDDGPGIDETVAPMIFNPFFTTKPHGLGMGLAISRALIEAHGGKIWHEGGPGRGATFHFTIPLSSPWP